MCGECEKVFPIPETERILQHHDILDTFNREDGKRLSTDTVINYCTAFDIDKTTCERIMMVELIMHTAMLKAASLRKPK